MATYKHKSRRRGVILLVLLGMLALFGATVFAFLVIASHAKQTSQALQKIDRVAHSPRQDLEETLRQLLRDTPIEDSVLRTHSLMRDLYGNDTLGGWVINRYTVSPDSMSGFTNPKGLQAYQLPGVFTDPYSYQSGAAGGQIIEFTAGYTMPNGAPSGGLDLNTGNPVAGSPPPAPNTFTMPPAFGDKGLHKYTDPSTGSTVNVDNEAFEFERRIGCILTIIDPDSALYNKSTRIVGYRRVTVTSPGGFIVYHRYQILPFEGVSATATVSYFGGTTASGNNFIINGTPFSGKGSGFRMPKPANFAAYGDAAGTADSDRDGSNTACYDSSDLYPFALLPNPTDPDYHKSSFDYIADDSANEDYDAPDYQNMLLALEQWDNTAMLLTRSPSLHRPALANYWLHYLADGFAEIIHGSRPADTASMIQAWTIVLQPYGPDGVRNNGDDPATVPLTYRDLVLKLKRRCLMRPLREDHPNFDGSNPENWKTYVGQPVLNLLRATTDPQRLAELEYMAQESWGAADLVPRETAPWFIDNDNDGLPDDLNNDAVPDYKAIPWDVDNDGDGVRDSIWVDVGLPIRSLPDGRKIKPLVAIHCIDLDGKLNLNASGSTEQLLNAFEADEQRANYFTRDGLVYAQNLNASGPVSNLISLQRGQGCGPAEINLYPVFLQVARDKGYTSGTSPTDQQVAMTYYSQLLLGGTTIVGNKLLMLDGRYGELWQRRTAAFGYSQVSRPGPGYTLNAGVPSTAAAGRTPEARAISRMFGYPQNYFNIIFNNQTNIVRDVNTCGYGLPMDLKGTVGIGIDILGRPVFSALRAVDTATGYESGWNAPAWDLANTDTPYELMLGSRYPQSLDVHSNVDNPFTIAEFEAILRSNDSDSLRLPGRLRNLIDAGVGSAYRRLTTTESWDIPAPALALPPELVDDWQQVGAYVATEDSTNYPLNKIRRPLDVSDLIAARVHSLSQWAAGKASAITYQSGTNARRIDFSQLLDPDLLADMRFDLNRPFGNGKDDRIDTDGDGLPDMGNGVVDEPMERILLAQLSTGNINDQFEQFQSDGLTYRFDHDNDGFEWRNHDASNSVIDNADHLIAIQEHTPGTPNFDPVNSYRQRYARQLYILMMALVDQEWYPYWDPKIANPPIPIPPPTLLDKQKARARAIAQWAVNVVDYRDPDSIMTPFEYDIYPFGSETATLNPGELAKTWDVDGVIDDPRHDPTNALYDPTWEPFRGVVWGCERPELLMTETLAFHDLKISDEATDNGQNTDLAGGDDDLDQKYRPEGSLFVELYNPQSASTIKPAELYDSSAGGVLLTNVTANDNPIWRMVVTTRENIPASQPERRYYLDPDEPNPNARGSNSITYERLVYFVPDTGSFPTPPTSVKETYFPSVATPLSVPPQRYAVIGPASEEDKGAGPVVNKVTMIGPATTNTTKQRRIEIDESLTPALKVFGDGQADDIDALYSNDRIQAPLALAIDQPQRLSVSELTGTDAYPVPTWDSTINEFIYALPYDEPFDYSATARPNGEGPQFFGSPGNPVVEGTHTAYRYVHLQRLADPMRDWNSLSNPYITVDSASVDLSVFNSKHTPPNPANYDFYARQRGENSQPLWQTLPPVIGTPPWHDSTKVWNVSDITAADPTERHVFAAPFSNSLGYVNHCFGVPLEAPAYGVGNQFIGAPGSVSAGTFTPNPFPWLTWLNRPFANPMELLQVPATSPSQLLMSFEVDATGANRYLSAERAFGHQLNFHGSVPDPAPVGGKTNQYGQMGLPLVEQFSPHFQRLLEYVQVPTRFVSSYENGRPEQMMGRQLINPGASTAEQPPHHFHPPYNNIHTYREPGKVNLNTAFEPPVLTGLMSDHGANWASFATARQALWATDASGNPDYFGLEDSGVSVLPRLPTRIGNPFRSFAGSYLVPPVNQRDGTGAGTDPYLYFKMLVREGANSTLLRAEYNRAVPPVVPEALEIRDPLVANNDTDTHRNSSQNSYFEHLPLQFLSNTTTTRSNVYAAWITVGYFQVDRVAGYDPTDSLQQQLYPEGYTLGQELGADSGDVTRYRAFYVIDRSIPAGFVPGEDLNTDNAVLLRRFIE